MNSRSLFFLLAPSFLLSSCLTSPNPFYADADIFQDERILGDYREPPTFNGFQDGFVIVPNNVKIGRYELRHTEHGHWMTFTATLFRVDGNTFLDIYPDDDSGAYHAEGGPPTGTEILRSLTYQRLHLVARITISEDGVGSSAELRKQPAAFIGREASLLKYVRGSSLLLPMATPELRKFLEKNGGDDSVLSKPGKLQKPKPIK